MGQERARGEADVHSQLHVGAATAEERDEGVRWEGEGEGEEKERGAGLGASLAALERQLEEELDQVGILPLLRAHPLLAVGAGVGLGVLLAGREGRWGRLGSQLRAALLGMATARLLEQVEGRFGLSEAQVRAVSRLLLASRRGRPRGRRGGGKRQGGRIGDRGPRGKRGR